MPCQDMNLVSLKRILHFTQKKKIFTGILSLSQAKDENVKGLVLQWYIITCSVDLFCNPEVKKKKYFLTNQSFEAKDYCHAAFLCN